MPYSPKLTNYLNKLIAQMALFKVPYSPLLTKYLNIILTFHFVCFCWIFFRCGSFSDSWVFINQIVHNLKIGLLPELFIGYHNIFFMISIAFLLHSISANTENAYQSFLAKLSLPLKITYLFVCIYLAIQFKQTDVIKPIYMQF